MNGDELPTWALVISNEDDTFSVWDRVEGTVSPRRFTSRRVAHDYRNSLQRLYDRRALTGVVRLQRIDEWA